jgi:hypothetical protein
MKYIHNCYDNLYATNPEFNNNGYIIKIQGRKDINLTNNKKDYSDCDVILDSIIKEQNRINNK